MMMRTPPMVPPTAAPIVVASLLLLLLLLLLPGALMAVAGTVVPATLLMLVLIIGFFSIKDNKYVIAALQGIRPFVVGLLAWTAFQIAISVFNLNKQGLGLSLIHDWGKWLIALGAFLILTFTNISPIWLVLATAGLGMIFFR